MSNESNRDARQISPSELQASDFFPPGHGWNKEEDTTSTNGPRGPHADVDDQDSMTGERPRPN